MPMKRPPFFFSTNPRAIEGTGNLRHTKQGYGNIGELSFLPNLAAPSTTTLLQPPPPTTTYTTNTHLHPHPCAVAHQPIPARLPTLIAHHTTATPCALSHLPTPLTPTSTRASPKRPCCQTKTPPPSHQTAPPPVPLAP